MRDPNVDLINGLLAQSIANLNYCAVLISNCSTFTEQQIYAGRDTFHELADQLDLMYVGDSPADEEGEK